MAQRLEAAEGMGAVHEAAHMQAVHAEAGEAAVARDHLQAATTCLESRRVRGAAVHGRGWLGALPGAYAAHARLLIQERKPLMPMIQRFQVFHTLGLATRDAVLQREALAAPTQCMRSRNVSSTTAANFSSISGMK